MGRKRNQGKARRAAKAKAKKEAEERDNETIDELRQQLPLAEQMQLMQSVIPKPKPKPKSKCWHGLDDPTISEAEGTFICSQFTPAFNEAVDAVKGSGASLLQCLTAARDATLDEYADVWNDSAKMKIAISFFLCAGTNVILEGNYDDARGWAVNARYFEQFIAVALKQTQAVHNIPKLGETCKADMHTLVKFFRRRIPCSCLNDKYEEVKHTPKMGHCYNVYCKHPEGRVERSKTMYCRRCRCAVYCSRECQVAHWSTHKPDCDCNVETIA